MMNSLNGILNRILRNIRTGKILNRIGAGRRVFFENPAEKTAFKYVPGEIGRLSKYYIKHFGQYEYEIDSGSGSILTAILEGKQISESKYDHYESIECLCRNLSTFNTPMVKSTLGS